MQCSADGYLPSSLTGRRVFRFMRVVAVRPDIFPWLGFCVQQKDENLGLGPLWTHGQHVVLMQLNSNLVGSRLERSTMSISSQQAGISTQQIRTLLRTRASVLSGPREVKQASSMEAH